MLVLLLLLLYTCKREDNAVVEVDGNLAEGVDLLAVVLLACLGQHQHPPILRQLLQRLLETVAGVQFG